MKNIKLVWFRNDLRTRDHRALYTACEHVAQSTSSAEMGVIAVAAISSKQWMLQDESKSRVQFWLANLHSLKDELAGLNIPLKLIHAETNQEIPQQLLRLAKQYNVKALYFNDEVPEYEQQRDQQVEQLFQQQGIGCHRFESDLVLPAGSVLNQQGLPYKVFTPFSKAWRQQFTQSEQGPLPAPQPLSSKVYTAIETDNIPEDIGYGLRLGADWNKQIWPAGTESAHRKLQQFVSEQLTDYSQLRDFPAQTGTSSLSPYLSVGVLTARQCIAGVQAYSDDPEWFYNQWVTELIWREFYRHLLILFPEMNRWKPFKPDIEKKIAWQHDKAKFDAWCKGETGFDIVDAGMKQLLETGWMHNRVRMITASFLTKLLRQDWRLGARFFMQHLIDGDFSSNLGGWQWSASVGADAAPYFRIFNPMRQADRFDAKGLYSQQWLDLGHPGDTNMDTDLLGDALPSDLGQRPQPIIDYAAERRRSIEEYQ